MDQRIQPRDRTIFRGTVVLGLSSGALVAFLVLLRLDRHYSHFLVVHAVYDVMTVALPLAFVGLCWFLQRRKRLRLLLGISAVMLVGLRFYATHIEPQQLQVRRVTIHSAKIQQPLKILHISDIQSAAVGDYEARAFRLMQELEPDLLISTGDILQPNKPNTFRSELPKLLDLIAQVDAPLGRFNVIGDTDGPLRGRLAEIDILRTLDNETLTIESAAGTISLLGLDRDTARNLGEVHGLVEPFARDSDAFKILFGHPPDFVLAAQEYDVDLSLAGHTHGGQVRLPFIGPIITLTEVDRPLARGFHTVGRTKLNTSAGIGSERAAGLPPIRFNCPPEMTLITLLPILNRARARSAPSSLRSLALGL